MISSRVDHRLSLSRLDWVPSVIGLDSHISFSHVAADLRQDRRVGCWPYHTHSYEYAFVPTTILDIRPSLWLALASSAAAIGKITAIHRRRDCYVILSPYPFEP